MTKKTNDATKVQKQKNSAQKGNKVEDIVVMPKTKKIVKGKKKKAEEPVNIEEEKKQSHTDENE